MPRQTGKGSGLIVFALHRVLTFGVLCCAVACAAPAAPPAAAPTSSGSGVAGQAAPTAAPPAAPRAAVAAPASGDAAVRAMPVAPPVKVRVDTQGLGAEVPMFLAIEQGYFRELGLDVELIPLPGSSENLALLNSGQLEVASLAVTPGMFNAAARGVAIRAVADRGSSLPGRTTSGLSVRADILARKPWAGYGDLRGLKVAIAQFGSTNEYNLEQMLNRGSVERSEIEIVPLPFPDMALAFANRAIDAGMFQEPWATQLGQQGIIKKVATADDVAPGIHVSLVVYGESFAQNTPAARNYMVAWLRGVRDYWDAYDGRLDFQRVVDALQKYTALKDEELIRLVPPTGMNPAGYLDPAQLAIIQNWFADKGQIPQPIDPAKVYDGSFAEYANSVLGPFQPVANPQRPAAR